MFRCGRTIAESDVVTGLKRIFLWRSSQDNHPASHTLPTASFIDFSLPWKAHPDAPSSLAMPGSSSHAPCRAASEMNPHTAWARLWTSAGQRAQRFGAKSFSDRADFLGRLKSAGSKTACITAAECVRKTAENQSFL